MKTKSKTIVNGGDKTYLILTKNNGKFFSCYGEDAYIMNLIFGYKILRETKIGFPDNILERVLEKLQDLKISYQVITLHNDPIIKDYKRLNNYNKYKEKALDNLDNIKKIEIIIEKIKKCDQEKLDEIVEVISKCLEY